MKSAKFSGLMLGTVQFGLNYGIANTHGKPSFDLVKELLKLAFDNGVTALDTAPSYGDSELVIGQALAELGLAGRFHIVTKVPGVPEPEKALSFIENSVAESMKRLRTESVDAVLFHREQDVIHMPELAALVKKGMIGGAGVSLDSAAFAGKASDANYLQVPCNVLDHRFDALMGQPGKQVFIRSVYLQGMLLMPEEKVFPEFREYRRTLESFGLPLAELCMRYLFSLPGNPSVLTGVDTPEQLRENIRLAKLGPLPEDLFAKVRQTVPLLPEELVRPSQWNQRKSS